MDISSGVVRQLQACILFMPHMLSKPGSQVPIIFKQKYNLQNPFPLCSHQRFMDSNNIRLSLHGRNHILYSFNTYFCQIAKYFLSIVDFNLFRSAMLSKHVLSIGSYLLAQVVFSLLSGIVLQSSLTPRRRLRYLGIQWLNIAENIGTFIGVIVILDALFCHLDLD